jgi:hypothetical protein
MRRPPFAPLASRPQTCVFQTLRCENTMHKTKLAIIAVMLLGATACASLAPPAVKADTKAYTKADAQTLLGTWTVDLRPQPEAPAYLKNFVITSISGNSFQGSFYDTPITEGRINVEWSAVRIAFVTADGSGPYNHSAVLVGKRLEGLTNATGRGFLAYWSAVRQ